MALHTTNSNLAADSHHIIPVCGQFQQLVACSPEEQAKQLEAQVCEGLLRQLKNLELNLIGASFLVCDIAITINNSAMIIIFNAL